LAAKLISLYKLFLSTHITIEKKVTQEMLPNLVGRFGTPEEVGHLVTFLASSVADFMTGVNYRVDGGRAG